MKLFYSILVVICTFTITTLPLKRMPLNILLIVLLMMMYCLWEPNVYFDASNILYDNVDTSVCSIVVRHSIKSNLKIPYAYSELSLLVKPTHHDETSKLIIYNSIRRFGIYKKGFWGTMFLSTHLFVLIVLLLKKIAKSKEAIS